MPNIENRAQIQRGLVISHGSIIRHSMMMYARYLVSIGQNADREAIPFKQLRETYIVATVTANIYNIGMSSSNYLAKCWQGSCQNPDHKYT